MPAHGVDIGEGVGRGNPAPVVGAVDHGGEEVGGGQHGEVLADQHRSGVVAVVQADQNVGCRLPGEAADGLLELTRRDLARATAAVGVTGETKIGGPGL